MYLGKFLADFGSDIRRDVYRNVSAIPDGVTGMEEKRSIDDRFNLCSLIWVILYSTYPKYYLTKARSTYLTFLDLLQKFSTQL